VLIEINARFWGSLPLSLACGVDFPCYLYEMLVGGRREFPQTYRTGLYCRNTSWDLQWLVNSLGPLDSSYHKKAYPLSRYILEWGNILLLREKNDVFVLDDPVPGIRELMRILRKGVSMVRKKVHKKSAPVPPFPKEHAENLPAAIKNSTAILFVCYGNICRSPFAEAYLRTMAAPGIRVTSCGYYPVADRRCTAEAVYAAKNYGVDLSGHRSRVVSDALIQESDVIFVFDEENLQHILTSYPESRDKVWFLSAVTQTGPAIIADPYGKDLAAYEEVYEEIAGNIRVLASLAGSTR
jgi:protein-tyrosine-phosphatase